MEKVLSAISFLDWILEKRKEKLAKVVNKLVDIITWLLMMHKFKDIMMPLKQVFEYLDFQRPKAKARAGRADIGQSLTLFHFLINPYHQAYSRSNGHFQSCCGIDSCCHGNPSCVHHPCANNSYFQCSLCVRHDMRAFAFLPDELSNAFKFLGAHYLGGFPS